MDQQNQNPSPDYSFILNKPEPEAKKSKIPLKLVAAVAGVFGVLVIVLVLNVLAPKSYAPQAGQVSLAYFKDIDQKQYDTAYGLLGANDTNQKTAFVSRVGPILQASYKMANCTNKGTTKSGKNYLTTINCPLASSGANQVFVVQTTKENNTMKITNFATVQEKAK